MARDPQRPSFFGVIDEDPFDHRTWSGSSRYLFRAIEDRNQLVGATATEPSPIKRKLLQALNFRPRPSSWQFAYHTDPRNFYARTKIAKRELSQASVVPDCILQVGAWYDMTGTGVPAVSYHDGNLARRIDSPYGYPHVSSRHLTKALAYERSLYQKLDLIFPMSQWLLQSFVKDFGIQEDKLFPVFAGVNLPEILAFEPPRYDTMNLLFVGRDFRRKGGPDLLQAFRKVRRSFPNAQLTLVGPTERIAGDGIHNLGPVSKACPDDIERVRSIYRSSSVFVMPTLYEPFGIVFAEAMAHGLPCIGTRVTSTLHNSEERSALRLR
jgi:glycosyltransferase involved in cell wall biosynthesis